MRAATYFAVLVALLVSPMGCQYISTQEAELYAQASPAELLPMGVPQLLLTGDSDPSVPVAHAAEYERLARARGDDVVLHTILRAAHFEVIAPWSERWPDVARPLFAFLKTIEDRSGPRQ